MRAAEKFAARRSSYLGMGKVGMGGRKYLIIGILLDGEGMKRWPITSAACLRVALRMRLKAAPYQILHT